jgi:nicotinamidase/pyrazinamidase
MHPFFDDGSVPIYQLLEKERITQLVVCGVATEYCVLHTVLDALKRRFHVALAIDAIAGIQVESTQLALTNMFEAGAVPITWSEYLYALTTHVATVSA